MNKLLRLILVIAAIGVGVWLWAIYFPNPKQVIRNRLNHVAQLASFSPDEGNLHHFADIQRLGQYFTEDVQVMVDIPGVDSQVFNSREDVMRVALAAKRLGNGLKAEFLDPDIEMGTGAESALVDLTLKAKVIGENDMIVQELKLTMKKVKGDWLISRVETVKTLKP